MPHHGQKGDLTMDETTANQSQESTTQETTTQETFTENTQGAGQTENTTQTQESTQEQTQAAPFLSIKYNKGEVPLTMEEAQTLAQKGLNYEKAVERAKQEARDSLIASYGYEWNGKPITTEAEYNQALRERELYDNLQSKNLPEDVVRELVENRKFRDQFEQERKSAQTKEQREQDMLNFLQQFPGVKPEEIPVEVWHDFEKGSSLVDAYTRHENKALRERVAKLEETIQAREKNNQNAQTSPGSVTGNGSVPTGYYSREQVEKMDPKEAAKPEVYKAIMESMKSWKRKEQ